MTSVTETGDNSSWLKQRSSIFSGETTPKPSKVVDKELARLKSSGVVSSIWSNKFVQQDNPGAKRASLNAFLQKDATSPKSPTFSASLNKQRSSLEATKTENTIVDNTVSSKVEEKEDQQITPENKTVPATPLVQASNDDSVTEISTNKDEKKNTEISGATVNLESTQPITEQKEDEKEEKKEMIHEQQQQQEEEVEMNPVVVDNNDEVLVKPAEVATIISHSVTEESQDNEVKEFTSHVSITGVATTTTVEEPTKEEVVIEEHQPLIENVIDDFVKEKEQEPEQSKETEEPLSELLLNESTAIKKEISCSDAKMTKEETEEPSSELLLNESTAIKEEISCSDAKMTKEETVATEVLAMPEAAADNSTSIDAKMTKEETVATEVLAMSEVAADNSVSINAKEIKQDQSINVSESNQTITTTNVVHDASVSVTSHSPFASPRDSIDTAAALWFQIETLKTKYAQEHARLERAYEDIEFYKHQLELQSETNKETLANVVEEKEREALRVRQLAELIVKQDQLLNEYENNLAVLTRLTDEATYLQETQAEIDGLRQELATLNQQKKYMQGAIDSLRGELEMSYSQMRLVMAVSTEIQNDFEKHKERSNKELQDSLQQKDSEHEEQIEKLQQEIKQLTETHQSTLEQVREVPNSTGELDALKEEVAQLKKSLEMKDATIQNMEQQMKNQKTDLESQIMELSQTIIEKDAHLLEIMNSRNNSESSIIGHMPPPPDSLYTTTGHDDYSYGQSPTGSHFQINQVRDYMISSSEDEDEEDEREILHLSYSSDEDDMMMMHHNAPLESPGTNSITSTITFESSDEEDEQQEKMAAELKHFSYTSVQSQKISVDIPEPLSEELDQPVSVRDSFVTKENSSSWPMPPPTPPPSEPLPPVPPVVTEKSLEKIDTVVPPPRRARSKTLVQSESTSPVNNELPRIIPLQKSVPVFETTPIPPPRKNIPQRNSFTQQQMVNLTVDHTNEIDGYQHTKWMDDPESEDDRVKDDWKAL